MILSTGGASAGESPSKGTTNKSQGCNFPPSNKNTLAIGHVTVSSSIICRFAHSSERPRTQILRGDGALARSIKNFRYVIIFYQAVRKSFENNMLYFNLFRYAPAARVLIKARRRNVVLVRHMDPFSANLLNASIPDIGQTLVLTFGVKCIR